MTFKNFNLNKLKEEDIQAKLDSGIFNLSKTEFRRLLDLFAEATTLGRFSSARNTLHIALQNNAEDTFDYIRKKGIFRYSAYTGKKCMVSALASFAKVMLSGFDTNSEVVKYLQSIINFEFVAKEYINQNLIIKEQIRFFDRKYLGFSLVKTLLSHVEYLFLTGEHIGDRVSEFCDKSIIREDICSATSYLIFLLNTTNVQPNAGGKVASEFIYSGEIGKIIQAAYSIETYKEIEVQIDHYSYQLIQEEGVLKFHAPSELFEKLVRLGYIRTDTQSITNGMAFMRDTEGKDLGGIEDMSAMLLNIPGFFRLEYTDVNQYPRYRGVFADFTNHPAFDDFFKSDQLYKDEAFYITWVASEQLIDPTKIASLRISTDLTLLEFIKMRRYFILMQMLYKLEFERIGEIPIDVLLHSITPQLHKDVFYRIMDKYFDEHKVDEFLNIVCWEPGEPYLFDLQYRPVIYIEPIFLLSFHMMSRMNVVRNLYASELKQQNKSLLSDGTIDPLTDKLSSAFTGKGFTNYKQVKYALGDIDLAVVIEDKLVLIECKHSLHPATVFEMRMSYDYIQKAQQQLDKMLGYHEEGKLLPEFEMKFGDHFKGINEILTMVVVSNRILVGNLYKHPVRDVNEVINFIKVGTFVTNDGKYSLWSGENFSLADFQLYLANGSHIFNHMLDTLQSHKVIYQSTSKLIEYDTYMIELPKALEKLSEYTDKLTPIEVFGSKSDFKSLYIGE